MGFLSLLKNRFSWLAALVVFIIATLSGEAVIRIADKYHAFDTGWMGNAMELLLFIVQSKIFAMLISVAAGILIGRVSLQRWPEKQAATEILGSAPKNVAYDQPNSKCFAKLNTLAGLPEPIKGWVISDRDDFDIIPHSLVVRCTRNDSGFDCNAIIFFKNRSLQPIYIQPLEANWMIGGKAPDGKMSHGVSSPISKDSVDKIRFSTIRIYGEKEQSGQACFAFRFGQDRENLRCALVMQFDFSVTDYPANKSIDAVINQNTKLVATYYLAPVD